MKNTVKLLAILLLSTPLLSWATASSANYQLGYGAFDGGGGVAVSSGYNLNASAIGTVGGGDGTSTGFSNIPGTPVIDDDGDGLDSGVEQVVFGTDPNNVDTDADTLTDLEEVQNGSDPLDSNSPFSANVPLPVWSLLLMGFLLISLMNRRKQSSNQTI